MQDGKEAWERPYLDQSNKGQQHVTQVERTMGPLLLAECSSSVQMDS